MIDTLKDTTLFRQSGLIGGAWQGASSGASVPVMNPATEEILGRVPDMGKPETEAASALDQQLFDTFVAACGTTAPALAVV